MRTATGLGTDQCHPVPLKFGCTRTGVSPALTVAGRCGTDVSPVLPAGTNSEGGDPMIGRLVPWIAVLSVAVLATSGCQSSSRIFYRAGAIPAGVIEQPTLTLAAQEGESPEPNEQAQSRPSAAATPDQPTAANGSVNDSATATQPAAEAALPPATQPAVALPYTAPGPGVRQLSFMAVLASAPASPGVHGAGREVSEAGLSSISAGSLATGAAGLSAPQARTLTAVVGQPGLQRGLAAGLGFARRDNLLTPRANPLTGPNGRCQDLVRAGLFSNAAACRQFFNQAK